MSLLYQLPRLSAYDPGAVGEGGLDPLGLASVADRIANLLAPGLRARMSSPRFVTATAVGAIAYQSLHELTGDQGSTTVDIAFEWLVVESLVRYPGQGRSEGLPGSQKATRAKAAGERLSRRNYLNGPRVFGFTGVYRPFSRDVGVLTDEDLPGENAARLVSAWERDLKLPGFVNGVSGTEGGKLRKAIADACQQSLTKNECSAPANGQLLQDLASSLALQGAELHERRLLRELIATGEHEIRNELARMLVDTPPAFGTSQRELAKALLPGASPSASRALRASIDYEDAATALDNVFRRFLAHASQQHGAQISASLALESPGLAELAPKIRALVSKALESAERVDPALREEMQHGLELFDRGFEPAQFFDALVERHEQVQADKKKLSWLDQINKKWVVRIPYRNQSIDLQDETWTHPMRLVTLAKFLADTQ